MDDEPYGDESKAPWFIIPDTDIMSIEHPCIIKNRTKAIEMLGGSQQLAQCLEQRTKQSLSLKFKPHDPSTRTILSLHNDVTNILLKVTIPKRTGRKRKRGSGGDFTYTDTAPSGRMNASSFLQDLQTNWQNCIPEVVGNITSCHVWRGIPDFVYFTKSSKFLNNIKSQIVPHQYPLLKQWSLPRTYGLEDTEIIPPPVFSTQSTYHNYNYRQNPAVKALADPVTGTKTLHNPSLPLKLHMQTLMYDAEYPTGPSSNCPPLEEQSPQLQELVKRLQELFDKRPIWTRRALINSLPKTVSNHGLGGSAAYVCFSIRSGPWRDAYVKFGVDPRSDPKFRKYQTLLLQIVPRTRGVTQARNNVPRVWTRSEDTESHIFTGDKSVAVDGKTWQLCDLQDPVLKELVDIPDLFIRPECEIRYFGWYPNGTSAKLRILLKAKIDAITEGIDVDQDTVNDFMQFPEVWVPQNKPSGPLGPRVGWLPERSSSKALEWASAYRSLCRTSGGSLPNYGGNGQGRLNKPKPKVRPSFMASIEQDTEVNGNDQEAVEVDGDLDADADAQNAEHYEEPEAGDGEDEDGIEDDEDA